MLYQHLLAPIKAFLHCETPREWVVEAQKPENLNVILTDHLLCELKAAQSALFLVRKYAVDEETSQSLQSWIKIYEDFAYKGIGTIETLKGKSTASKSITLRANCTYAGDLVDKMVLLIKEELHHFYQVLEIMNDKGIAYKAIPASRYAKGLLKHVAHHEPLALIDKLIIGAIIEARSCERFAMLAPHLDDKMERFYVSLLRSEARHYQDYLTLAGEVANNDISQRVNFFLAIEAELIESNDCDFKFHSGRPTV
ncbi:tRNA isopentenyl-2-thiomethyl-A-37 hydroxylase MiaE [Enterovibrio paralichthyis]|uniref:tRNA isopentenyl-2-thiomethyl-A-37 hydroxylase MiaE n=1 Tax=Enterovibrio paralichthyis TaxID=2853805 RepID=UPI001C455C32|nr:tRNA isopentenyl-2-thiomethyl-A-37 hydroxylase MiaE [Enterovibrio paralichthyis]MBV7300195.1 tRNA isopentenyl-2-thiomethyl-A-37 hydroxylase MiaE [Enterovibrio paralichthyis]